MKYQSKILRWLIGAWCCIIVPATAMANAAQPGIFRSGGASNPALMFPEDSLAWKSIQMREELVVAIVRPGYAVVKGTYHLYNHSADTLRIRTGYPVNASYRSGNHGSSSAAEILYDDLYELKVRVDGIVKDLSSMTVRDADMVNQNWYVWETTYLPNAETTVEVWFLVNTNEAVVRKGYAKDNRNAFMYVLETGAHWKPPIEKGEVRIKMDGVSEKDIAGVSPDSQLTWSSSTSTLRYAFSNLLPSAANNVIVTYGEKLKDFDFASVVKEKEKWFGELDQMAKEVPAGDFANESFGDPFEVQSMSGIEIVFYVIIGGIALIGVGVIVLIVRLVKRASRKA